MLSIYSNIKKYRKLNKWTQEELAEKVGYTNRSTIAKIEKGGQEIPQSMILKFARVFGISPGELMGDDGTNEELQSMSNRERRLLAYYRMLTVDQKGMVDRLVGMPEDEN